MSERGELSGSASPCPGSLSEVLLGEQSLDELLELVVGCARRTIPGVDGCSVTLAQDGRMVTSNFSDDVVRELDEVQYRYDAGPCVDALRRGVITAVVLEDEHVGRYAPFAAAARSRFMTAVLSTPLIVRGLRLGGLNLYSASLDRFGDDEIEVAALFARQASVVLANGVAYTTARSQNDSLQEALATRETIGMAKGILMATTGCSADDAFDLLRTRSQHQNRKLRDVAADMVAAFRDGRAPPRQSDIP
jgi:GAF domain-containing protein